MNLSLYVRLIGGLSVMICVLAFTAAAWAQGGQCDFQDPKPGDTLSDPTTFKWQHLSGAIEYEFTLSNGQTMDVICNYKKLQTPETPGGNDKCDLPNGDPTGTVYVGDVVAYLPGPYDCTAAIFFK